MTRKRLRTGRDELSDIGEHLAEMAANRPPLDVEAIGTYLKRLAILYGRLEMAREITARMKTERFPR